MPNTTGRFWPAAVLALGVACGSPSGPPGAPGKDPSPPRDERPPTDVPAIWAGDVGSPEDRGLGPWTPVELGTGRNALSEELRGTCVRSPAVATAEPAVLVRFGRPMARSEAAAVLGVALGSRSFFHLAGVDARASFGRAALDVAASLWLLYGVEYRVGSQALDPASLDWLVAVSDPGFTTRCGDEAAIRLEMGGQLLVLFRIDLASEADLAAFVAEAGAEPAAWEVSALVHDFAGRHPGRVAVHVGFLQVGGDVTAVSSILEVPWRGAHWCGVETLWNCDLLLRSAVQYGLAQGPGSFAESVRDQPAELGIRLEPWTALGAAPAPRAPGAEVLAARTSLQGTLREQLVLKERLRALAAGGFAMAPELAALVWEWQSTVDWNLVAVRTAERQCYDLITDPADGLQSAACAAAASPEGLAAAGFTAGLEASRLQVP